MLIKMRVWGCRRLKCGGTEYGDGFNTFGSNCGIEMDSGLGPHINIFVAF